MATCDSSSIGIWAASWLYTPVMIEGLFDTKWDVSTTKLNFGGDNKQLLYSGVLEYSLLVYKWGSPLHL